MKLTHRIRMFLLLRKADALLMHCRRHPKRGVYMVRRPLQPDFSLSPSYYVLAAIAVAVFLYANVSQRDEPQQEFACTYVTRK